MGVKIASVNILSLSQKMLKSDCKKKMMIVVWEIETRS